MTTMKNDTSITIRERVAKIGRPTPLVAVISEPAVLDLEKPAFVVLNSGVMHHIGTCRLSVKMSRSLAEQGILAARFDFSGVGDSAPRSGTQSFTASASKEIVEVLDYLEKSKGIKKFVLCGLCSGADAAYEAAKIDQRIVGMCQIDAYCYRTWKWNFYHYAPKVSSFRWWIMFGKKRYAQLMKRVTESNGERVSTEFLELPSYVRKFPPREEIAQGLRQLINRNVALYNIFTNGQKEILNYRHQYVENFPELDFADTLKVDYFPESRHIITEPKYQKKVVEEIVNWVLTQTLHRIPAADWVN